MYDNNLHRNFNILIVEDHKLVSALIKIYLMDRERFNNVEVANDYNSALEIVKYSKPQIAIMDILLKDKNGIDLAIQMLEIQRDIKIIFLTSVVEKKIMMNAIKIGASGFVLKSSDLEEISTAIHLVMKGDKYFSTECMQVFLDVNYKSGLPNNGLTMKNKLTTREKEILELIIEEKNVPAIADMLCLSPRTIETHKKNIMSKFGVNSTLSLVKKYYENQYHKIQ